MTRIMTTLSEYYNENRFNTIASIAGRIVIGLRDCAERPGYFWVWFVIGRPALVDGRTLIAFNERDKETIK